MVVICGTFPVVSLVPLRSTGAPRGRRHSSYSPWYPLSQRRACTCYGSTDWLAQPRRTGECSGSGAGRAWDREWQLWHRLHFPLMEPIILDRGRSLLLLFLPLADQFICLLAPPGQRGGGETQIPFIWVFSRFDKGLDGAGVWRCWVT